MSARPSFLPPRDSHASTLPLRPLQRSGSLPAASPGPSMPSEARPHSEGALAAASADLPAPESVSSSSAETPSAAAVSPSAPGARDRHSADSSPANSARSVDSADSAGSPSGAQPRRRPSDSRDEAFSNRSEEKVKLMRMEEASEGRRNSLGDATAETASAAAADPRARESSPRPSGDADAAAATAEDAPSASGSRASSPRADEEEIVATWVVDTALLTDRGDFREAVEPNGAEPDRAEPPRDGRGAGERGERGTPASERSAAGAADSSEEEDEWEDVEEGDSSDLQSASGKSEAGDAEPRPPGIGCAHYRRKCKLVAPCCGEVFWCRHCHNEIKSEAERDYKKAHDLDRYAVTEIICALCDTRQCVSNTCVQCGAAFAAYFCKKCNFWDDEGVTKEVYHCDDCGLCRTGGQSNYFHCQTCGSCYSTLIRDTHKCVEKAMHQPCPICCENMFTSVRQVHVLKCGHTMHAECLRQLNSECLGLQALRCPLCCKSLGEYGKIWERLDEEVERTPLPDELKRKAFAKCNDCDAKTQVDYHIVGLKCGNCGGYNTREVNP
ncbi:CHY zinc finger domain-containing protein [Besnoitia besnoiti]|uniref:CHY zinc finger domain-containing protein n=1 Tax=Besnoitia besnoiti TaxID=94643 RepID=A0A2A9MR10_BESBE|nr:CHY zinc finger domain-containing protein [Besnoitia besnoiti]PFH38730.1 CHY zinc finger domain-containing protein [Besnoitia besnoiti]